MADANFSTKYLHIISRQIAKSLEMKRYFTGKPCPHGHISQRYTSSGNCHACLTAASKVPEAVERSKYLGAIRYAKAIANRPPKEPKPITVRDAARLSGAVTFLGVDCDSEHGGKRYVTSGRCVACLLAIQSHPAAKERKKAWAIKNKDKLAAARIAKYPEQRDRTNERARLWALANPEKRRTIATSYKARRRAIEKRGDATSVIHAWEISAKKICYWCSKKCKDAYHTDHYEPLAKGGAHEVANLVISCPQCNLTKNAKDPYEFAARSGKLF